MDQEIHSKNLSTEVKKKVRDCNVDLIRILACFTVIFVHINFFSAVNIENNTVDKSKLVLRILSSDGVTMFFIMMGFFMFKAKSFTSILKKTFFTIIIPSFATLVITDILDPWLWNKESFLNTALNMQIDWIGIANIILSWGLLIYGTLSAHLWYIFSYFQVILLFPILKLLIKENKFSVYIIIYTLITLVIKDLKIFFGNPWKIEEFYLLAIPAVFALTGYEIYKNKDKIKNNIKVAIISLGICITSIILRVIMQYHLFIREPENSLFYSWSGGFSFLTAASFIVFILSFDIKNKVINKVITFLGQRTFVIYLIHYMIIIFLESREIITTKVYDIIGVNASVTPSMSNGLELACLILRFIPVFVISLLIATLLHILKILIMKGIVNIRKVKQS